MKRFIQNIINFFRSIILRFALKLRAKMRTASLRAAIEKADEMKSNTGRKTVVVFDGNDYVPLEKKHMKRIANRNKRKQHPVKHQQVKEVLKRSVYVAN